MPAVFRQMSSVNLIALEVAGALITCLLRMHFASFSQRFAADGISLACIFYCLVPFCTPVEEYS